MPAGWHPASSGGATRRPSRWRRAICSSSWRAATRWWICGSSRSRRTRCLPETGAAEFIIERTADEAVVASNADGMTAFLRRMPMEQPTESELLAADLVMDQHDPVYEAAVRAAAVFLASARQVDLAG